MTIYYDSDTHAAFLSVTEEEKAYPHSKIPVFGVFGPHEDVFLPLPISVGLKCIIEEYLRETCDDFPTALEKMDAIGADMAQALKLLTRPNGHLATDLARKAAGLSRAYFLEWLEQETDCRDYDDFLTRFDYCDEKLKLRYSVAKDRIVIYLANGSDTLLIRRFDPRDPEVFRKMCDQALFIADDALGTLYQEGLHITLDGQGRLQNPLYEQIRQAYEGRKDD